MTRNTDRQPEHMGVEYSAAGHTLSLKTIDDRTNLAVAVTFRETPDTRQRMNRFYSIFARAAGEYYLAKSKLAQA